MNLIVEDGIIGTEYKYHGIDILFFHLVKIVGKVVNKVTNLQVGDGKLWAFFLTFLSFVGFLVLVAAYFLYRSVWFDNLYTQYCAVVFVQKGIV